MRTGKSVQRLTLQIALLLVISAVATASFAQAQASDEEIAKAFTPRDIEEYLHEARTADREIRISFIRAKLGETGDDNYLIVGYANFDAPGVVRVIRANGSDPVLVAEARGTGGRRIELSLLDIDNDGKPEIIAYHEGWKTTVVQVFRWNGSGLVNLSPTRSGNPHGSYLSNAVFEDLDGDGVLEAIASSLDWRGPIFDIPLYKLQQGGFVEWKRVMSSDFFKKGAGSVEIGLGRLDVPYLLRIANADPAGAHPVTDAEIVWNGAVVASVGDFMNRGSTFTVPVNPKASNVLTVKIRQPSNGSLRVIVEPVKPIVPFKVIPEVECVTDMGEGKFSAQFGFKNPNPSTVYFDNGPSNKFTPKPINRGQNGFFPPGRHRYVFRVESLGEELAWTLDGKTVTASLQHPTRCPPKHQ